jgi:hypothetical protein
MSQFDVAAVALPASAELESPCETRAKSATSSAQNAMVSKL